MNITYLKLFRIILYKIGVGGCGGEGTYVLFHRLLAVHTGTQNYKVILLGRSQQITKYLSVCVFI